MGSHRESPTEEAGFCEFRRKVRDAEVLSGAMEKILKDIHFSGKLCIVVKNGSVQKSGYEESLQAVSRSGL
jgi:hypothetical protein